MKKVSGIDVYQKEDITKKIMKSTSIDVYVYDKELKRFDFITNVYEDESGDFIIEIGGDA